MSPPVENSDTPVVTDKGPDIQTNSEPSKSGKALVGIIYPPLEIRNIVDKTASFVARNGPEFESRIKQHEAGNPRFNFLTPTDPYHAYYQHKVKDFAEGKAQEPQPAKPSMPQLPQKVQEAIKAAEFVPKDPPAEYEFCAEPATINAFDLDLIKLTACFVARNGRQFLTQLMTREARNYQFDFLKPQHSNFNYFTKLVEQYTKILLPPKNLVENLQKELKNPLKVVLNDMVKYRVEWERYQRRIKEKEEAEVERERVAYAQIDWHDFVVVQTVDFQQHEMGNLPPPCTPKDVGARLLAQQRIEATKASAQTMEMEVDSGGESEEEAEPMIRPESGSESGIRSTEPKPAPPSIPAPPNPDNVVIRRDYNPRNKQIEKTRQGDQKLIISPLTGEKIPADKLAEHMRFNTVDSQYFTQKERQLQEKQDEEPVYAPGSDISANILNFAERRTDIFGVGSRGAEQTVIGKKLGEEDTPRIDPKAIWDGHTTSINQITRAAHSQITIEDQIAQIHRSQGLLVDQDRIGPKTGAAGAATRPGMSEEPNPPMPPMQQQPMPPHMAARPVAQPIPTAAAFAVRPAVVPVVQMAPASVLMVQQHTLVPMGQFLAAPQGPFGGAGGFMGNPAAAFFAPRPAAAAMMAPVAAAPIDEESPAMKRARLDADQPPPQLVDEAEWLRRFGAQGPITVSVACPSVTDKPEWHLNGQTIGVSADLTELISSLKLKIQDLTNLPSGKQKLVHEGIFVKDSQSLASYNLMNGSVIQLQLKERGGRKK